MTLHDGSHAAERATGLGASYLLVLLIVAVAATGYAWLSRRALRGWSSWRTTAWLSGCLVVALAPVVAVRPGPIGHMAQHLLLGMVAPLGLVLAAPVTLLLRSSGPAVRRHLVSRLRTLARLLRSRPLHVLGHPIVAAVLSVGGLALLLLTPLYGVAERNPLVHQAVHFHYLAAGYLFVWSIAGPDPAPRRPRIPIRVAVLILAGAAHSILAKYIYAHASTLPMGESPTAIQQAAQLMYYGGDLTELLLATALFASYFHPASFRRTASSRRDLVARPVQSS
ncbi:cytochrome c oxidase assembly protein [Kribbella deserti]|uniref:Cytochrome c oxidase assembly protein n=1 Tax=Kribbella deserti TaxID=1926257 RepID=A0ABV6QGJ4_9ACTN